MHIVDLGIIDIGLGIDFNIGLEIGLLVDRMEFNMVVVGIAYLGCFVACCCIVGFVARIVDFVASIVGLVASIVGILNSFMSFHLDFNHFAIYKSIIRSSIIIDYLVSFAKALVLNKHPSFKHLSYKPAALNTTQFHLHHKSTS